MERNGVADKKYGHGTVPMVYPLHVKKFSRRAGHGRTTRVEAPLFRTEPERDLYVHAPIPQRTIPMVNEPSEDEADAASIYSDDSVQVALNMTKETIKGLPSSHRSLDAHPIITSPIRSFLQNYQSNDVHSIETQLTFPTPAKRGTFAHLHGTRERCVRHGRKPSQRAFAGTEAAIKDTTYRQGLSLARSQTMPAHEVQSNIDACPDCLAELVIRKRETALLDGREGDSLRRVRTMPTLMDPSDSSPLASRPVAGISIANHMEAHAVELELGEGEKTVPGKNVRFRSQSEGTRSSSNYGESDHQGVPRSIDDQQLVKVSDLGDGLDAVILERGGRLEQIIMNTSKGAPTVEGLIQLSRELMQVAKAIAAAKTQIDRSRGGSVVAIAKDELIDFDNKQGSIKDLLEHLDAATGGLELESDRKDDSHTTFEPDSDKWATSSDLAVSKDQPLLLFDSHDPVGMSRISSLPSPKSRLAQRQSIDADYEALRRLFGRQTSCEAPGGIHNGPSPVSTFRRRTEQVGPKNVDNPGVVPDILVTGPTLPSHILTARDTGNASPPMFTNSTCPSLNTSATSSAEASPDPPSAAIAYLQNHSRGQTPGRSDTGFEWNAAALERGAGKNISPMDKQTIREAMRMQKNLAVQGAAAVERETRRMKVRGAGT